MGTISVSEENKSVVRRYLLEAWGEGKLSLIDVLMVPDVSCYVEPLMTKDYRGTETVKQLVSFVRKVFPDLTLSIEEEIAEGDRVAIRWTSRGTYLGEWEEGVIPTGKAVEWKGATTYQMAGGKIVKERGQEDGLGLLYQLGSSKLGSPQNQ